MRCSWDKYFLDIAKTIATRSTCNRKHVGAVIVRDKNILSTGYNGSIKGQDHCNDDNHLIENNHCIRTIHAEANAIVQAAKNGVKIEDAIIYITASPCFNCFKLIANAGINKIIFIEFYKDEKIFEFAKLSNIELINLDV
jgi:dCMP deaminase